MNATKTIIAAGGAALLAVGFATATMAEERELHSDAARNKLDGFEYTGESRLCLPFSRIRDIDALDDWTLLVEMRSHAYYVTHLVHQCPMLAVEDRFTYTLRGINRLCEHDLITVLFIDGRAGATCGLSKFEELSQKEAGSER